MVCQTEGSLTAITGAQSTTAARTRTLASSLHWSLALLLAMLPFELNTGIPIAGLTFTNLELAALVASGLWGALLVSARRPPRLARPLALGAAALLVVFAASALLAGDWRGAALKFTTRQAQGALLALCLADQLARHGWPLARHLGLALLAGMSASAALGLLEIGEIRPVLALLAMFKDQPTTIGGLLRLSATFAYANIAAMAYEAALPLALVAVGLAAGRRAALLMAGCATLLYVAALLTYSRAALLTAALLASIVALGALALRRRADRPLPGLRRVILTCGGLLALTAGMFLLSPTFRVRIAEPDIDRWYRAEYLAAPIARLAPNELARAPVTISNRGLVTWRPDALRPVALSYHWLEPRTRRVVRYNGHRTELPGPLEPGQSARIDAYVQAPSQPGSYILAWDMVTEQGGWFSERGSPVAELPVIVSGAPAPSQPAQAAEPANVPQQIIVRPPPPARGQLWAAAARIWLAHPALGIGPDVFRHVYGPAIGLRRWDDRVHTNNLYIELLVGAGVAGLAAFLALVAAVGAAAVRALAGVYAADTGALRWALIGCGAGLAAFLIHGMLDMFLEYSATYLLLWALLGALSGLSGLAAPQPLQQHHLVLVVSSQ